MYDKQLMLKIIGERFKHYRKLKGFSREDAAKMLGVTSRTLAAYERGEREISTRTTLKMAQIYGTTFRQLTNYRFEEELSL